MTVAITYTGIKIINDISIVYYPGISIIINIIITCRSQYEFLYNNISTSIVVIIRIGHEIAYMKYFCNTQSLASSFAIFLSHLIL